MRGQQDRAAGFLKGANDVPKLAAALRIEPGGWFVEKKHSRRSDQRRRHRQTLPLPAGKFPDPRIRFLIELKRFQNFVRRSRLAIEAGKKRDRFAHRQFFSKPCFLQRDADFFAQLASIRFPRLPENRDFAGSWFEQAFENLDGRRLPGAVGAEQAKTFSRLNFQIQPAHGFDFAVVGLAQVTALDGGGHEGILLDTRQTRRPVSRFLPFAVAEV